MKISLREFYQQFKVLVNTGIYDLLDRPNWSKGDALFSKVEDGTPSVVSGPLVNFYPIVNTDAQLNDQKSASFGTVFNQWERISLNGANKMTDPAEAAAWNYDSANDAIVCTVNSVYTTGFLSPDKYDSYIFEVELSSADGDDDAIGLCLAYLEENGVPMSLMVYRTFSTVVPHDASYRIDPVYVVLNPASPTGTMKYIGGVTGTLHHADGSVIPAEGITTNGGKGSWGTAGPVRLKVERTATQIKIWASDVGSPTVYSEANSLVIPLTSADLKRFQQPAKIGYIAFSQPQATFKVFQSPGSNKPIIDARDNSTWKYENRAWVKYAAGNPKAVMEMPQGRLFSSTVDKQLYFTKEDGVLSNITPP
jgi:hypothetical protein